MQKKTHIRLEIWLFVLYIILSTYLKGDFYK